MSSGAGSSGSVIREVWGPNLEQEMAGIRDIIFDYPYISTWRAAAPLAAAVARQQGTPARMPTRITVRYPNEGGLPTGFAVTGVS
ncbi:hypothetical protein EMIHUDRAFT_225939 [Emiliania huxleyi CCMP1516]|uniref:Uncharacterized protein n=2 Tax=Emiliania huxleyi TaxID=2903 RepID=A0A0D3KMK5_EMIH1|nr:hypothetical protein EMIHUDRAFT_225939 [Emiliania huxleyi CCMP1516]EOD36990.1 hypothetical protein EMIHUDRAFT_225939 [Emiliania huxleyi CCMP1516]|eukprot:XP_005789419.1 hypothetical protein EMIHUDRAFT_225939 [Emiliania huxleyi CCMP1516]